MARLVTLDVTNTIIKVARGVGFQYAKVAKEYDVFADPVKLDEAFRSVWRKHTDRRPNFGAAEGQSDGRNWWSGVMEDTFRLAGTPLPQESQGSINSGIYEYFKTREPWEVIPGTREFLARMHALGKSKRFSIGVISNFDDRLETVLKTLDLNQYFDFVVSSFLVKSAKPDSSIFLKALGQADVSPHQAIHVGDDTKNDYLGARAVGMRALLLQSNDAAQIPDTVDTNDVIRSLNDIFRHL